MSPARLQTSTAVLGAFVILAMLHVLGMAAYVISLAALKRNTAILRQVKEAAGCKLVLALKGFSCWKAFDAIRDRTLGAPAALIRYSDEEPARR